ncbi:Translocon-associated protein subunit beta like [Actinidia chinensis var. chinensis]|uniref:Translocon-associated protein subunit beta like n=1 Tax=Actinidia chinensis var. chinensis TaxID=1590841 RepID=A0A2R6PSB1_ACTCC|nr:Translocon-associated protein subunit beta like [Actinidia chinensis var. chinensis]
MAIPSKLIIFTLSSLLLISEAIAISESPFIVAHKKASLTKLKSGAERVSVSIDIYNRGSAAAYDVSLTDNSWSQEVFEFVSGNTTKSWDKLEAGSLVSHSFELESKLKAAYNGAPAVITFRIPTKAKLQEAYSTPILPLDILADKMPETMFKLVTPSFVTDAKINLNSFLSFHLYFSYNMLYLIFFRMVPVLTGQFCLFF